jgi:hypothetical protein
VAAQPWAARTWQTYPRAAGPAAPALPRVFQEAAQAVQAVQVGEGAQPASLVSPRAAPAAAQVGGLGFGKFTLPYALKTHTAYLAECLT